MRVLRTIAYTAATAAALAACTTAAPGTARGADCAAPADAAGWQQVYDTLPYRGDGNFSAPLPDGRSVWVTGDAIPRAGGTWASNTVTVVNGSCSWQTANVVPDADGVKTWLGPVAVAGEKVVALTSRVRPTPGVWPGFASVGTGIATMRLDAGAWWPSVERVSSTPWSATGINWTAGIYPWRGYLYVFGQRQQPGTAAFDVYLARVPADQLHTFSAWRFWQAQDRWSAGPPAPILTAGTDSAFSVRRSPLGWHLYTRHAGAHGEFVGVPGAWRWVPRGTDAGYLPASHPEVGLGDGRLLVTLNVEGAGARFLEVSR